MLFIFIALLYYHPLLFTNLLDPIMIFYLFSIPQQQAPLYLTFRRCSIRNLQEYLSITHLHLAKPNSSFKKFQHIHLIMWLRYWILSWAVTFETSTPVKKSVSEN
jgi:hypothetical protein